MKRNLHTFLRYWLPPIAWATAIFVQSSFRMPVRLPSGFSFGDKFLHAIVYAALAWLLLWAFHGGQGLAPARAAGWAFLLAALYGALDELHQGLVPSRTMEWGDWFADVAGAATVFLAPPLMRLVHRFNGTSTASPG